MSNLVKIGTSKLQEIKRRVRKTFFFSKKCQSTFLTFQAYLDGKRMNEIPFKMLMGKKY